MNIRADTYDTDFPITFDAKKCIYRPAPPTQAEVVLSHLQHSTAYQQAYHPTLEPPLQPGYIQRQAWSPLINPDPRMLQVLKPKPPTPLSGRTATRYYFQQRLADEIGRVATITLHELYHSSLYVNPAKPSQYVPSSRL